MGWVRFGPRSGFWLLSLAAVALGAMTANAAEGRHHRNVHAQDVHRSGLVHRRVHARLTTPIVTRAAVRMAAQLPDEEATIILSTPEPGAVVTSTKPAPNTGEPAKAEPEVDNLAKPQAHGPGGWLIQIGAFDMEAEAKQHLSEARLSANTALAAADPITAPVQRVDKVLYRARFAALDK